MLLSWVKMKPVSYWLTSSSTCLCKEPTINELWVCDLNWTNSWSENPKVKLALLVQQNRSSNLSSKISEIETIRTFSEPVLCLLLSDGGHRRGIEAEIISLARAQGSPGWTWKNTFLSCFAFVLGITLAEGSSVHVDALNVELASWSLQLPPYINSISISSWKCLQGSKSTANRKGVKVRSI